MAVQNNRERFIPYQKFELVNMICNDFTEESQKDFQKFCQILESVYHFKFHRKLENLKQHYFPFNPDIDTNKNRTYDKSSLKKAQDELENGLIEVLNDANYQQIKEEELQASLISESLFKISLVVDFNQFDKCLLYWRGDVTNQEVIRTWYFKKKKIEIPTYKRIAMLIKFKEEDEFNEEEKKELIFKPGTMIVKLFKNIPKADMEMLFPNTKVRMRLKDKLLLGIPAFLGGMLIILSKSAAILYAIPLICTIVYIFVTKGLTDEALSHISNTDMAALIAAAAALGAIVGYAWRQWVKYRSRKIEFMKTLSENLYFKNLDNNMGVFHHLIDSAEEEECKEVMLSYHFLTQNSQGLTLEQLDNVIEKWLEEKYGTQVNFEVDDALRKLLELEICTRQGAGKETIYTAIPLKEACKKLDNEWDNYFPYNNQSK